MTQQADVISPVILRNAGVPVDVHVLDTDATGTPVRVKDEAGAFKYERRFVKIDNRVLMDIESVAPIGWGSQEAWEEALDLQPVLTLALTFAIVFDFRVPVAGSATGAADRYAGAALMLDSRHEDYIAAINGAFMLATGVEPEIVGESLRAAHKEARVALAKINDGLREAVRKSMEPTTPSEPVLNVPETPPLPSPDVEPTPTSPEPYPSPSPAGVSSGSSQDELSMSGSA